MDIETSIAALKDRLAVDRRVAAVLLFGSAGRGAARASSDLDVGLIARSQENIADLEGDLLHLTGRLALAAQRAVQLVLLDTVEPVLGRQAFLHGRILLDRDPKRRAEVLERILASISTRSITGGCARRRWSNGGRLVVVDRDIVLRKSEAIEHHTSRLRRKLPLAPEALQADEGLLNDVCFDLLQATQTCIDLAVHACSHEALGTPETPAAAFALLARRSGATPPGRRRSAA